MATATQPATALLTLDEYLHTFYKPDCEFVDGHLEERNVGDPKHGLLQMQFAIWLFQHPEWKLRAISELRTRVSVSKIRLPDVSIVPDDDLLLQYPRSTPPLIAIEVLSPEDRWVRVIPRLRNFLDMGVVHVWIIDPEDRVAFTFTHHGLKLVEGDRIEIDQSPVYLDLPQLFSALPPKPTTGT